MITLEFSLSMQRVGMSRPHNATHDCDRVLEHLKRLALLLGRGVSVQCRARDGLLQLAFEKAHRVTSTAAGSSSAKTRRGLPHATLRCGAGPQPPGAAATT